jgi:hypothetical protein
MSRRLMLSGSALVIVASMFSACSSERGLAMTDDEARVWMSARAQNGIGVLDGNQFKIQFGEVGDSKDEDDWVEFAGGRFHSVASDTHQFGSGPYATVKINGGVEFHATCKNTAGGTMWWQGTVRGDDIEGRFVMTVPGDLTVEHAFHGRNTRPGAVQKE